MGIANLEFLQAKKDSSSSEGSDFCRICHCGSEVEELISPCHCSGSLGKSAQHPNNQYLVLQLPWLEVGTMSYAQIR